MCIVSIHCKKKERDKMESASGEEDFLVPSLMKTRYEQRVSTVDKGAVESSRTVRNGLELCAWLFVTNS